MAIYIGADRLNELHIGANVPVQKIYLGTQVVWRYLSPIYGEYLLFDEGWVSGVSWQGNPLPRPDYTSIADYDMSMVESDGFMRLRVKSRSSYSSVNYNTHVATLDPVEIPGMAQSMHIQVKRNALYNPQLIWGVLPLDAPNALDTSAGGQLSTNTIPSGNTLTEFSFNLDAGIAGTNDLRAVVSMRANGSADGTQYIDIYKVWFE